MIKKTKDRKSEKPKDDLADKIVSFIKNKKDTKIVLPEKESHEESKS